MLLCSSSTLLIFNFRFAVGQVKEPDYESMIKYGKVRYLPPRFMTVRTMGVSRLWYFYYFLPNTHR